MRLASNRSLLSILGFIALSSVLTGCPEKGGSEKTTAEPERPEVDDQGKAAESKKPTAAPAAAEPKKEDEKDKGGW
jgi:predicted  nucleic acid-binding Zn-ribbon protein